MTELDEAEQKAKRAEAALLDGINQRGRSAYAWVVEHRLELGLAVAVLAAIYILAHIV